MFNYIDTFDWYEHLFVSLTEPPSAISAYGQNNRTGLKIWEIISYIKAFFLAF